MTSMTSPEAAVLNSTHEYEILAVTLLLITPSALNRAWTSEPLDPAKVKAEIARLPLSDGMKKHALRLTEANIGVRPFFRGIADLQAGVYAGAEPHPSGGQATAIINALQKLDERI